MATLIDQRELKIMTSSLREHCLFHTGNILIEPHEREASKCSPADHICHFVRAAASPKMVPISPANVQTNFDDICELLGHSFSHSFIQLILGYMVGILASSTSIPNTKAHCFGESY